MPNIADLTRQLREEIRKQYGVEAYIHIHVYDHWEENKHIKQDSADQIAVAMSRVYGGADVKHHEREDVHWVNISLGYKENAGITIFYPGEVPPVEAVIFYPGEVSQ
jgi:hypothetical protein